MRRAKVLLFRSCLLVVLVAMMAVSVSAQHKIEGVVYDSSSEETLAGVSVNATVSRAGTSSGADGRFQLLVSPTDSILRFELIGYRTEEIKIQDSRLPVEVFLRRAGKLLDPGEIRRRAKYHRRQPPAALIAVVIATMPNNKRPMKAHLCYRQYEYMNSGLVARSPIVQSRMGKMNFSFRGLDGASVPGRR